MSWVSLCTIFESLQSHYFTLVLYWGCLLHDFMLAMNFLLPSTFLTVFFLSIRFKLDQFELKKTTNLSEFVLINTYI